VLPPTHRQKPTHKKPNGGGYAAAQTFHEIRRKSLEAYSKYRAINQKGIKKASKRHQKGIRKDTTSIKIT
jgi:hypothetical protein